MCSAPQQRRPTRRTSEEESGREREREREISERKEKKVSETKIWISARKIGVSSGRRIEISGKN